MIKIRGFTKRFDGFVAVDGLDLVGGQDPERLERVHQTTPGQLRQAGRWATRATVRPGGMRLRGRGRGRGRVHRRMLRRGIEWRRPGPGGRTRGQAGKRATCASQTHLRNSGWNRAT